MWLVWLGKGIHMLGLVARLANGVHALSELLEAAEESDHRSCSSFQTSAACGQRASYHHFCRGSAGEALDWLLVTTSRPRWTPVTAEA